MPGKGSGRVLSFTSAATTVVGTVISCQSLAENSGVEMTSPETSTLLEDCRSQPSRRGCLSAVLDSCAETSRELSSEKIRTPRTTDHRLFVMSLPKSSADRRENGEQ